MYKYQCPPLVHRLPEVPVVALQPLREFEILLIICAIVFLALLLLGIGCSYYCLKKRNIRVIRRRPVSTIGSEVTRISDPPSMFEGLKIPRAHATDTSGERGLRIQIRSDPDSPLQLQTWRITGFNATLFYQKIVKSKKDIFCNVFVK